jgi:hypothetical protein
LNEKYFNCYEISFKKLCFVTIAFPISKQGDSGGPLFYFEKQVEPMLIGIVSTGNKEGGL